MSNPITQSATTWVGGTLGVVADKLAGLVAAWQSGPPDSLHGFLPAAPDSVRRFTLIELIKVDLDHRWRCGQPKRVEEYCEDHPDVLPPSAVPVDLLYVEYQARLQNGCTVLPEEYGRRFPGRREEFAELVKAKDAGRGARPANTRALAVGRAAGALRVGDSIDDYDVLAVLGSGSFATVYFAWQRSMQRQVAIKISASLNEEPQTLARLDHPFIVRVHDVRASADGRFRLLSMEPVSGGTLQMVVERIGGLPPEQLSGKLMLQVVDEQLRRQHHEPPTGSLNRRRLATLSWPKAVCHLGAQMAAALAHAHQQGVLHRDIKPANVLLTAEGCPKLADFNVSFSAEVQGATVEGCFGGTLAYMSPEQLHACHPEFPDTPQDVDTSSDVFSLGVVTWEVLTGRRPWEDTSLGGASPARLARMAAARREGVPQQALAQLPAEMPPALRPLLARCLAADPSQRPAAGELACQLVLCLDGHVQRLFHPQQSLFSRLLRRSPLVSLALLALLPNVLLSLLNIAYNQRAVAEGLAPDLFSRQVALVNLVAYGAGVALSLWFALPVTRAVALRRTRSTPSAGTKAALRARCIGLGSFVALLSMALWSCCGIVFPVWTHLAMGQAHLGSYVHFILSQVFCGAIAGSLGFFLVTFAATRALLPRLLSSGESDRRTLAGLRWTRRQVRFFFLLHCAVPSLCVMLLAQSETPLRFAFLALGALGMAGLVLALWLMRRIHRDIAAISRALAPVDPALAETDDHEDGNWQDSLWSVPSD